MVSRSDLLKDDVVRQKQAAADKRKQMKEAKEYEQQRLVEDTIKAETLLDGELGELFKKMNAGTGFFDKKENGPVIALTNYKVWCREKRGDKEGWCEAYEDFDLGFTPKPDYKPTKLLLKKLKKAGFKAEIETIEFQNQRYYTTADGYDAEDIPGTHPEYYLVIEW